MSESYHYSIIIPAHNEEAFLPATLRSVEAAMVSMPAYRGEVIVVDNDSTDSTASLAESLGARVITETVRNIARVRNTGVQQSTGQLLIFLDADTLMTEEMLKTSLGTLHNPEIVAGSFLLKPDRTVSRMIQLMFFIWNMRSRWNHHCSGCFLFCKKEVFNAIGGYDESFYAAENINFSARLNRYARRQRQQVIVYKKYTEMCLRKMNKFSLSPRVVWDFLTIGLMRNKYKKKENCKYWY
ncbi:glycosyltransferase [Legionella erythra]|uniref:UDP-Glc:alpha-D-GlcNAc-diphosphoundecaprenol beta-1,3-glucosyltransferase WfgD n=1 Tax=Legionella erythra TaxID=448 RepID=A0A0W0TRM6_LEGER|nr:glycosyltransferase [Legionella erythra]KTC98158.1 UDP-Glc:alpha-D-GlcNAc-diphosphoundecaprenol beta-1,3-glucosyltransferase WfgD [Legionella erythra]